MLHYLFVLISWGSSSKTGESVYKREKGGVKEPLRRRLGGVVVRSDSGFWFAQGGIQEHSLAVAIRSIVCRRGRLLNEVFRCIVWQERHSEVPSIGGGIQDPCSEEEAFHGIVMH